MHIFIGTPAYSGTVHVQYALSLAELFCALTENGIRVTPAIRTSGSLIVAERNRILEQFWMSDATHLLCIDSDLGFPSQAVFEMLKANKEFIAGCYPARNTTKFIFRPVLNEAGGIVNENHLLKMESVPAGFMLLSRSCIEKMRNKFPELYYAPKDPRADSESTYCLFNTEVYDGEFWGEDYVFCKRAREAGVEIWVDPLIQFDHAGTIGSLSEILTNKPPELQET
jgi:hypothetical protein